MIQNIWAVGRNYAEHAKELGNDVPTEPMIFLKAGSTATLASSTITMPAWQPKLHHEVELALRFNSQLKIAHACLALDLTDREKQNELKSKGHPWTLAKSFKGSCPLSDFFSVGSLDELKNLDLSLKVNGELRQRGSTSQMIFSLEALIEFVLKHFPVVPGDLLLTGTPAGVGPFKSGDVLEASIAGKATHTWKAV